ncbi:MAG: LysR family transcriptional regulator [Alphaproteobacteria bacterium]|nr:LysR family transcriptional regulator [Alphaproteobacteria bacterium]
MNSHLESDLLRTFVAIADSGSFTRAAETVHRTQSAVSMQVKRLEDATGTSLFDRGTRGVKLTAPGEKLLGDARRILTLIDQAAASLRGEPLEGAVRIGIPADYGPTILPRALGNFAKNNTGVEITVRCGASADLNAALSDEELDLVVVWEETIRAGSEVLLYDPTVWATSESHCPHEQDPMPVALYEHGCWCRDWAVMTLDQHPKDYRVAYTSDSSEGLKSAVSSGLAIAPLSRRMIPPGCRELTKEDGFWNILDSNVVMRRRSNVPSPVLEEMAAAIREAFQAPLADADVALSQVG